MESKAQSSTAWNNVLLTWRRNRAKSTSVVSVGPPEPVHPSGSPHNVIVRHVSLCCRRMKDLVPYPQRKDIVVRLIRYHMAHMLKQNKGVYNESEMGKNIPT